jgi:hypothetical protein
MKRKMGNYSLIKVLMERDGMERLEADYLIRVARKRVLMDGEDPEKILLDEFGLEPDYIMELLF